MSAHTPNNNKVDHGRTILFTGGGSAGHVTPNLVMIKLCQQNGWNVHYIGSLHGIEKTLIERIDVPYHAILSGKLRRYFSWQNFIDPMKIAIGILQACWKIFKIKPTIIFSKGGFVAFPVVVAGWLNRIPVIIHESDLHPGLANKLSFPFAKKICVSFTETEKKINSKNEIVSTGTPIRSEFFTADAERGRKFCAFDSNNKKIILIIGGGLGAQTINIAIRKVVPQLQNDFNVVHLCGHGKTDSSMSAIANYRQFEYLHEELFDVMAAADIVISRAGANALSELLALKKVHILIPLSSRASRGDQILNANYFKKLGLSKVIDEDTLSEHCLLQAINELQQAHKHYQQALANYEHHDGAEEIYKIIAQ